VVKIPTPAFKVPAPVNIIEALAPVLSVVISPVTVTVPVEIVIWCLFVIPPLVNAMLPAFKIPAPTASVLVELEFLGMVTAPETERVTPELMLTVPPEFVPWVKVRDLQDTVAVTVTVAPLAIVTSSPEPGTTPPTQVVVAFQLPPVVVLLMAVSENLTTALLEPSEPVTK